MSYWLVFEAICIKDLVIQFLLTEPIHLAVCIKLHLYIYHQFLQLPRPDSSERESVL